MSQTNHSRYKYSPDAMDEQAFLANFVVRNHDFDDIFDDIKQSDYNVPNQHFIIVGQRGQGKTTLLRKIMLEVQSDETLSKFLLPIKFNEEQYQIRSLSRLWEEIADYLQSMHESDFPHALDNMEQHFDDEDYDARSFHYLEKTVKAKNKKLLVLIDNIDELLGKLKEKEQRRLREILLTSPLFKIVGGSTKMLEQQFDYAKPFYEFFKVIKLVGLNKQECFAFLASMGDEQQQKKIAEIITNTPERIETLRRLTGGVPRTIVMLFDIFVDDGGDAFDDLLQVLDEATPLYKHRMDDLPDTLQEITHTIAMNWDGISTKDIAAKTRLKSKSVSAQLKQLEDKYGVIESISIGKNKVYKIEERFFNIWYLMRFGRKKDRQRVEWLVNFLTSWCSKTELENRAKNFIKAMKSGVMKESTAYHLCEALSYAGLDMTTEHQMKQDTKAYLSTSKSKYATELSPSDFDIIDIVNKLINENDYKQAISILLKSQKNNLVFMRILGDLYDVQGQLDEAEEYYLKAITKGDNEVLFNLGILYQKLEQFDKAEEYYLKAIDEGDVQALFNLGFLYKELEQYDKAEEYYLNAIDEGSDRALLNLGNLYEELEQFDKTESYYLKAIDEGDAQALLNLGNLYQKLEQFDKAEMYFLKSIDEGYMQALGNLGVLYVELKQFDKAEAYLLKALDEGDAQASFNLGVLYKKLEQFDKSEMYFLKAIDEGDVQALFNLGALYGDLEEFDKAETYLSKVIDAGFDHVLLYLGILYEEQEQFDKAEEYYLKAFEKGVVDAVHQLAWLYFEQGKKSNKALLLITTDYERNQNVNNTHSYASLLLWNEQLPKSYDLFIQWLNYSDEEPSVADIGIYLTLLMAKKQLNKTKEFLEMPEFNLKEKCKPIWYALMTLMQDEYPHEITKIGSELQENVNEILQTVEDWKTKYALA